MTFLILICWLIIAKDTQKRLLGKQIGKAIFRHKRRSSSHAILQQKQFNDRLKLSTHRFFDRDTLKNFNKEVKENNKKMFLIQK